MALHLKLKPRSHHSLRLLSSSSSASPPPFPPPPPPSDESPPQPESQSQSQSSSAYFSDIRQRLGSSPSPSRRIPTDPPAPSSLFASKSEKPSVSLDEIRKQLANFRVRSPSSQSPASPAPPRFQELFRSNLQNNPPGSAPAASLDSIRQTLQQSHGRDPFKNLNSLRETLGSKVREPEAPQAPSLIGSDGPLPQSIFGREANEMKREEGERESKGVNTQLIKQYTYQELGEKLVKLRPAEGEKKKEGKQFSLTELNRRLAELRKQEEAEVKLRNNPFEDLRESLRNIQDESKKSMFLLNFSVHFYSC